MTIRFARTTASALALTLHFGLSACITAPPGPISEDDDEGSRRVDEEDATSRTSSAAKKKKKAAQSDAGSEAMQEPLAATRDGGAQQDPDEPDPSPNPGMQSAMDEQGEGSAQTEQRYYCGILWTTVRICNGTQNTDYGEGCVDDATDCLSLLPPDERIDFSEYCYTRTEYEVFGDGAQVGTCAQFDAYWAGEVECLKDSHCGSGERCDDTACACPEGAACVCPNCGPMPARCEGDVLVELIGSGPCDEHRACVYEEHRTDCAAQDLTCDPYRGCASPSTPPPPPPSPNPGTPGGPGMPGVPGGAG